MVGFFFFLGGGPVFCLFGFLLFLCLFYVCFPFRFFSSSYFVCLFRVVVGGWNIGVGVGEECLYKMHDSGKLCLKISF